MCRFATYPSAAISFRRLFACCLLFLSATLPLHAWAVDTDGDGVDDSIDAFPTNPEATTDTDGDGKPDSIDKTKLPIIFSDAFNGTAFQSGWSATSACSVSGGSVAYTMSIAVGTGSFSRVFNVPSSGAELSFLDKRLNNCATGDLWVDSNAVRGLFQVGGGGYGSRSQ